MVLNLDERLNLILHFITKFYTHRTVEMREKKSKGNNYR